MVGYAFAINGKINSADVYANNELFTKLWPKLLKASAAEAVADANRDSKGQEKQTSAPKPAEIEKFLTEAESKPTVQKSDSKISGMTEQESDRSLLYKTRWYAAPKPAQIMDSRPVVKDYRDADLIHTNYISK